MTDQRQANAVPRLRSTHVPRPRITTLLSEVPDFPVTVVKAGAGYGKTTAVANYVQRSTLATHWLTLREADRYGARFVERIGETVLPKDIPFAERDKVLAAGHSPLTWLTSAQWLAELLAAYVHGECLFVLDDFHLVDEDVPVLQWVDVWLRHLPPNIHVVFVTRTRPALAEVEELANQGEVLSIRERDLAFTEDEVGILFHESPVYSQRGVLNRDQTRWLVQRTRGMPMVLSMLLRDWRQYGRFERLKEALDEGTSIQEQIGRLFVHDLPDLYREALLRTCVFTTLDAQLCDEVLARTDSTDLLLDMERRGYLTQLDDGQTFELHPLVREYLEQSLSHTERQSMADRAIAWHLRRGEESRAIPYLFAYSDDTRLAEALFTYIPAYLERGEISTVQGWLDRLPPRMLASNAGLLVARAEVARHANRFAEAISHYKAAETPAKQHGDRELLAQVELGQARLYLDTIQPEPAMQHIRRARSWAGRADRQLRCNILQLAFENSINQGRVGRAKRLQRALTTLPGTALPNNNSDVRLLLRCGRVLEVISALKPRISVDAVNGRNALSHREATLLQSLMYAMCGDAAKAKEQALRGHGVGHSLSSPFVTAVGRIRLGHAEHLNDPLGDRALTNYQEAVDSMDELAVPRGKAEALLGLCLAHGYRRSFGLARSYAQQGIDIARRAGDLWMANLVRAAFGQVAVVNEAYEIAIQELGEAAADFERCGDPFLQTASRLWRAVAWFAMKDGRWSQEFGAVLKTVEEHGWTFLLERPTLCGVRDTQTLVPMLQQHQTDTASRRLALRYLSSLASDEVENHPGYTLRVQTLGRFAVWRGYTEMSRRDWRREKARQLFQFLITHRSTLMHREEICERLWGEADADTAERDFKVALTVLSSAIEPNKPGRGLSSFLVRQGSLYALTSHPMLAVDRDLFVQTIRDAESEADPVRRLEGLTRAMDLYQGTYLSEVKYETWCDEERDKLQLLFIQGAMEAARLWFGMQRHAETIAVCERVLAAEPTWEEAYVWLMKTYAAQYNRSMVMQTYRTCERVLARELNMAPMASTQAVFRQAIDAR